MFASCGLVVEIQPLNCQKSFFGSPSNVNLWMVAKSTSQPVETMGMKPQPLLVFSDWESNPKPGFLKSSHGMYSGGDQQLRHVPGWEPAQHHDAWRGGIRRDAVWVGVGGKGWGWDCGRGGCGGAGGRVVALLTVSRKLLPLLLGGSKRSVQLLRVWSCFCWLSGWVSEFQPLKVKLVGDLRTAQSSLAFALRFLRAAYGGWQLGRGGSEGMNLDCPMTST